MNVLGFAVILGVFAALAGYARKQWREARNRWGAAGLITYGLLMVGLTFYQLFIR